jgi:hypothetical protein
VPVALDTTIIITATPAFIRRDYSLHRAALEISGDLRAILLDESRALLDDADDEWAIFFAQTRPAGTSATFAVASEFGRSGHGFVDEEAARSTDKPRATQVMRACAGRSECDVRG